MKPRAVYFARCFAECGVDMQAIKIGCTDDIDRRLSTVHTLLPFRCEFITAVPGDMFIEKAVHLWLRRDQIRGEFFHARGAVMDLIEAVSTTGELPFAVSEGFDRWVHWPSLNLPKFMEARDITFKDVEEHTGLSGAYYGKLLAKAPNGNRSVCAAITITAVRMGQSVHWPDDFTFDYVPEARAA